MDERAAWRVRLGDWVMSPPIQRFITAVIVLNAITLGAETSGTVMRAVGDILLVLDQIFLAIYVIEIGTKLVAFGWRFFKNAWNVFDFIIVGIALVPTSGSFAALRALRILRVLRLISVVPSMRKVVEALARAIPGMGSILLLISLIFYVFAVIATKLYAATFPDWFGTIGESAYSLFQIMTLESWSMGIVRPVMDVHPNAWAFFVPFILVTTFAVVNLVVGIVVGAMQEEHDEEQRQQEKAAVEARERLSADVMALRGEVAELKELLEKRS
ncbi:MAG: ion transporter [Pseudomonadota bacterium]